ncbi:hypothetical protein LINPERPRIM_LOCUS29715 [Linum perenne]
MELSRSRKRLLPHCFKTLFAGFQTSNCCNSRTSDQW